MGARDSQLPWLHVVGLGLDQRIKGWFHALPLTLALWKPGATQVALEHVRCG